MITIIIMLVLLISIWIFLHEIFEYDSLLCLSSLIVVVGLYIGFVDPIQGFKEPELIQEIELVSLSNTQSVEGNGNLLYVSVSSDNAYSYRYEVQNTSDVGGKSYKLGLISGDITEIETNTDRAVLRKYVIKPKRGLFTFAIFSTKYKYEFIVPQGSIKKEITLN